MMQSDHTQLPELVQRLITVIGLLTTVLLVDRHGGQSFRLYATGEAMNRLSGTIGTHAATQLLEAFGSDEFEVPVCAAMLRAERNARIQAEFDTLTGGEMSAREAVHQLANRYGPIRERTIWRILKQTSSPIARPRRPVDERQMSLL